MRRCVYIIQGGFNIRRGNKRQTNKKDVSIPAEWLLKNRKAGNLWNNWHREDSKFARRAVSQAPFTCNRCRLIPKSQFEHFCAEWFIGNCNYTIAHLFARLSLCLIGVFGQIILQYSSKSILSLGGWGQRTPKSTQGEVDPHSLVGVQTRDKT